MTRRVWEIERASRAQGGASEQRLQRGYRRVLRATRQVVNQARRFSREIASGVKRASHWKKQAILRALRKERETMIPRVKQVIRQARARLLGGDTHVREKLVSLFEPTSEIIRKGKASKPTEFGKMVKVQEAENQIITQYQVYDKRPNDSELVVPAVEAHQQQFGPQTDSASGAAGPSLRIVSAGPPSGDRLADQAD